MDMIIFSDLDGTLLDQGTYSFDPALPALRLLREKSIPVVFVSSKTREEIEVWRRRLGNEQPFIVENGGGIYIPKDYFPFEAGGVLQGDYRVISLGKPYEAIRKQFADLRDRMRADACGFGDMTLEEIMALTGLQRDEAERARNREFTEPFVFPAGPDERFLRAFQSEKLRWTQGEIFHAMGDHHKGRAVERLHKLYEQKCRKPLVTIGIGDSLNDLPFLLAVDKPVLIRKKTGRYDARIEIPGLIRSRASGAAGWNETVGALIGE